MLAKGKIQSSSISESRFPGPNTVIINCVNVVTLVNTLLIILWLTACMKGPSRDILQYTSGILVVIQW